MARRGEEETGGVEGRRSSCVWVELNGLVYLTWPTRTTAVEHGESRQLYILVGASPRSSDMPFFSCSDHSRRSRARTASP